LRNICHAATAPPRKDIQDMVWGFVNRKSYIYRTDTSTPLHRNYFDFDFISPFFANVCQMLQTVVLVVGLIIGGGRESGHLGGDLWISFTNGLWRALKFHRCVNMQYGLLKFCHPFKIATILIFAGWKKISEWLNGLESINYL